MLGLKGKGQLRTTNPNPLNVKVTAQLCLTPDNLMDCNLPGSSVHGIFQARILERVAIPFSRGSSQPRDQIWVSHTAGRFFTVFLPPRTIVLGCPSAPAPSIQYRSSCLDWRLISCILYMFQCHSPKSSHPLPLPQSPKDCSIHQCLFCCLIYRVCYRLSKFHIYALV